MAKFYYELNVNGFIHDYQICVATETKCNSMVDVITIAQNNNKFKTEKDYHFVVSYSTLTKERYIEKYT